MSQPPEPPPEPPSDQPNDPAPRDRADAPEGGDRDRVPVQQSREEAEHLHREALRLKAARRKALFDRIAGGVYLSVLLLEVLLGLRFFLRLSGANPENIFAETIYTLSEPFVAPFSSLFVSPAASTEATIGKNIFDINLLIAIVVYAILGGIAIRIVRYIQE